MLIRQGWMLCSSECASSSTVLIGSDKVLPDLRSKVAEEFHDLGIPCSIYCLSFERWILALQSRTCQHCIDVGKLCFQIDNSFQLKDSNLHPYGHFNESGHPLQFSDVSNGRYDSVSLSTLEQTCRHIQFWQQKIQCSPGPKNTTVDKAAKANSSEHLVEAEGSSALSKQNSDQDCYIPCLKNLSSHCMFYENSQLSTIISNNSCQLRCLALSLFTFPLDIRWKAPRLPILPVNGFKQKELLAVDTHTQILNSKMLWDSSIMLHRNGPKDAHQTQDHSLRYFESIAMVKHLFWPMLIEHCKKNGSLSVILRKTKCCGMSAPQTCSTLKDRSFSSLLDLSTTDGSTRCCAGTSTMYSSLEKILNEKKGNKGKCNAKGRDSVMVSAVSNGSVQEFSISGSCVSKSKAVSRSRTSLACKPFLVGVSSDINLNGICVNGVNVDESNSLASSVQDAYNPEVCPAPRIMPTIGQSSYVESLKPNSALLTGMDGGSNTSQADDFSENYDVLEATCSSVTNLATLEQNGISKPQTRKFINPQFRTDDVNCSQLMDCDKMVKVTIALASDCQQTVPCSHQLSLDAKVALCGGQSDFVGMKYQGGVDSNCVSVCKEGTMHDSHGIGTETGSINRNPSHVSDKGSLGGGGVGSVVGSGDHGRGSRENNGCNFEVDKVKKDIKAVDDDERIRHSAQAVGRESDRSWSGCKVECPVVEGKKGPAIGPESSSTGSAHSFQSGNGYKRVGKENKHCIWQKVQRNTGCSNATEPKASEHLHMQSGVSKNGPQVFKSSTAGVATSVQVPPTITQHDSNCGLNKEQSLKELENHKEHGAPQGNIHHNISSDISMQGSMPRSQRGGDAATVQQLSLRANEKQNGGNIHVHIAETGKGIWARKKVSSRSNENSPSSQKGAVDFSQQPDCLKILNNGGRNILNTPQHKARLSDSYVSEQLRSSHGASTLHEYGVTCQIPTEILPCVNCSEQIQGSSNLTLPMSSASTSVDQMMLQRKQVCNCMTSARQIAGPQHTVDESSFCPSPWKGRKISDFEKVISREKNIERDRPSQHVLQKWVPVEPKTVGVAKSSSMTDKGDNLGNFLASRRGEDGQQKEYGVSSQSLTPLADSHIMHFSTDTHFPKQKNENVRSDAQSEIDVSAFSIQGRITTNNGDHKHVTVAKTGYVHKASIQPISEVVNHVSCDGELKNMAHSVLKSINASCRYQMASENITCSFGSPLAEFEKVLHHVSPVIVPVSDKQQCQNSSMKKFAGNSVCRCQVADVPLRDIWKWYEEPGNYGLEVKAWDTQHSEDRGINGNQFRAYFVPYLSGMQLFGFSSVQLHRKGAQKGSASSSVPQSGNFPILATQLPKPSAADAFGTPECLGSSSFSGSYACNISTEDVNFGDFGLLFEYFESEQPQQRRPMFEKIRELSRSNGNPHVLESIKLGDLHPASWFAVAWYPVYRIPEGHLRAAFLTYHSLGNFFKRSTSNALDRGTACNIVAPVVGLQSYNSQAECWFVLRKEFKDFPIEGLPSNPSKVLQERLKTLEETAASMARGLTRKCNALHTRKHLDYEFFLGHRR